VVNLLSDNGQHIFSFYLKFNPLTLEMNGCSYLQKINLNGGCIRTDIYLYDFLCFVDRASLYNVVYKTNLVHNLFLVYLSISTCFGNYVPIIRRNNCVLRHLALFILCG